MADRSSPELSGSGYTVTLCPPDYPRSLRPFTCTHHPIYQLCADARAEGKGRQQAIVLDNPICMACGTPLPTSIGGNILVFILECRAELGWNGKIGRQLDYLQDRYLRIAARLFDEAGWIGRHRKWAMLIDRNLTMRIVSEGTHPDGTRVLRVFADNEYFRDAHGEAAHG